jgi:hypothetical protein
LRQQLIADDAKKAADDFQNQNQGQGGGQGQGDQQQGQY